MTSSDAENLVELGNELLESNRLADAEGAFMAAARNAPDWSVPWYNLGLLCKYQNRWSESFDYNRKAVALDPSNQGGWWNLGIASTALGEWAEARNAWTQCGIRVPEGAGPPDADYGLVPIRLDPSGDGEVVWAHRIDPARARLTNVPLPTSSFSWNDLVLHDGAPQGFRMLHGKEVPVFNVLMRLQPSGYRTFVVELGTSDPSVIEGLQRIAHEAGGAAENWGQSTRMLCRECSLGVPHEHPNPADSPGHPHCGVAARDESELKEMLDRWLSTVVGADLVRWLPAPGPT
jgi:hypothetical protein